MHTEPGPDSVSDGSWGGQIRVSRKRRLCVCSTVNKAGGSPGELEPSVCLPAHKQQPNSDSLMYLPTSQVTAVLGEAQFLQVIAS